MVALSRLLSDARKRRGWSLRKASSNLGISPMYLSQMERGKKDNPCLRILVAINVVYRIGFKAMAETVEYEEAL